MKVARDGQQSGNESTAFVNFVPCAASNLRTFGICARSAAAWSSVMTTRMLGRPSCPALAGRAAAGVASTRSATTAAIGHTRLIHGDRTARVTRCQLLCYAGRGGHLEGSGAADAAGEQGAHRGGRDGAD